METFVQIERNYVPQKNRKNSGQIIDHSEELGSDPTLVYSANFIPNNLHFKICHAGHESSGNHQSRISNPSFK